MHTICGGAFLVVASAFSDVKAISGSSCETRSMLDRKLSELGIRSGYSPENKTLVVIGCAEAEMSSPDILDSMFLFRRNKMILAAELDAKKNLIKALKTHLELRDESAMMIDDVKAVRANESVVAMSAQRELRGCVVLRTCETYADGVYQVGVVIKWSARMSQMTQQALRGTFAGKGGSSSKDEWKKWALQMDWSVMSGDLKFIDSEGVVRYVGIGCADVEGLEMSSPWMRRAQDSALNQARANLSLALYADTASVEEVLRLYSELSDEHGDSADSYEEYVGKITRHSDKRTAFAPEVYATFVTHPITKRKMFVSVCGYEPWQLSELGIIDRKMLQRPRIDVPSQKPMMESSGVMIFNPNTGKFEKQ